MTRIKTCMEAVVMAGNVCQIWRVMNGDQKLNLIDMLAVAEQMDEENPPEEDFYYMVSAEGAIGITWKWEFLVNWLYIPDEVFDEEEPAQMQPVQQSVTQMDSFQPTQQPVTQMETFQPTQQPVTQTETTQPVQQSMAQTVSAQPTMQTMQVQPPSPAEAPKMSTEQKRFCRKCGKMLQANARFCKGCGTPVQ